MLIILRRNFNSDDAYVTSSFLFFWAVSRHSLTTKAFKKSILLRPPGSLCTNGTLNQNTNITSDIQTTNIKVRFNYQSEAPMVLITSTRSMNRMALRRLIASKRISRSSRSFHAASTLRGDALDMCDTFSRRHCKDYSKSISGT